VKNARKWDRLHREERLLNTLPVDEWDDSNDRPAMHRGARNEAFRLRSIARRKEAAR
jgi:hypothetical protein